MRTITLACLFVLALFNAKAQKIHFSDTTNVWHVLWNFYNGSSTRWGVQIYSYKGSVYKNGFTYQILSGPGDSALIREDTLGNKVYALIYKNRYFNADTVEFCLYDFGLKVGDTLSNRHFNYRVTFVGSIKVNNVYHKLLEYYDTLKATRFEVIEGIGTYADPILPFFGGYFEENKHLVCFQNSDIYPVFDPPLSSFDKVNSCNDTLLTISNNTVSNAINVFPQPAFTSVTITMPYIKSVKFELFNLTGQKVYAKEFDSTQTFQVDNEGWQGLYLYKVMDYVSGQQYVGKMVFQ